MAIPVATRHARTLMIVALCVYRAYAQGYRGYDGFTNDLSAAPAVPLIYRTITNRTTYPEPALPALGAAGSLFSDPVFGTRLLRVTDANTRPGSPGHSFTTPSAAHQLAWNANSDRFYVRSVDGAVIPYVFDPLTMKASRINSTASGDGGLTISTQVEPQFSFLSPNILFASRQDPVNDWPIIRQFDFDTGNYTDLVNLGNLTTVASGTYAGALSSNATTPEKLSVLFGGSQDSHYKVAIFRVSPPGANSVVLDSRASTITTNGTTSSTNIALGVFLHHAWMDQSGRFVTLQPVNASPVPYYVWDLSTGLITTMSTRADGHEAPGFGRWVNQSCCTSTSYDAAQWQLRTLSAPDTTSDLINPVLTPQEIYLADHTSWNNGHDGTLVPILSSLYRYNNEVLNTTPWRPWDDEIVAIQTNAGSAGATVWRFAHHRSDVRWDGFGTASVYFWYLPRAVISPDGRWAMFTSNWEKTLGPTVGSEIEPGGAHRCDVFMVALAKGGFGGFTDDPLTAGVSLIRAVHIVELRSRIDTLRGRFDRSPFPWTDPSLAPGMTVKAVHLNELRTALQQAYSAAGRTAPVFTDAVIIPGTTTIRVAHVQELRDAVIELELT